MGYRKYGDSLIMKTVILFNKVNCELMYQYGCKLHDFIDSKGKSKYCIQIRLFNKIIYQYVSDDCSMDNERWLNRKANSVLYFGMSTHDLYIKNKESDDNLTKKYALERSKYTFTPGSIPIVLYDQGVVGCVSVSGMLPEEDHGMIVDFFQSLNIQTEME